MSIFAQFVKFIDDNAPEFESSAPTGYGYAYGGLLTGKLTGGKKAEGLQDFVWDCPVDLGDERHAPVIYSLRVRLRADGKATGTLLKPSGPGLLRPSGTTAAAIRMPESEAEFQESLVTFAEMVDQMLAVLETSEKPAPDDVKTSQWNTDPEGPTSTSTFAPRFDEPSASSAEPDLDQALSSKDETAVLRAARGKFRVKPDQIIDIYNLAKELKSNRLMNLAKGLRAESARVDLLVHTLLEDHEGVCAKLKAPSIGLSDVAPRELVMGLKVELEHTRDPKAALTIALHHLAEDPAYYSKGKARGVFPELS